MDKKGKNISTEKTNLFLLITLILLFCLTLFISVNYIIKYYKGKKLKDAEQLIEITTQDVNASIINNGMIEQTITNKSFEEKNEIIVEKINVIEMISNNENENKVLFNIKYDIKENDFNVNANANSKSSVLVKFSYSYDMVEWHYINNVISTNTSNIMPLVENNYDIAGLTATLNVVTDFEMFATNKETKKMYWRSETIFKNVNQIKKNKTFKANFTINT